jgi:hypothetical protein
VAGVLNQRDRKPAIGLLRDGGHHEQFLPDGRYL